MNGELRIGGRCERHLSPKPCAKCAEETVVPETMDLFGVRVLLQKRVSERGTQKAVAVDLGVSEQYLSDVLNGRREPGEAMLEALGLERVVTYRVATPSTPPAGQRKEGSE